MSDITKKEWLQDKGLLYCLHNGVNCDMIRVEQVDGSHDTHDQELATKAADQLKKIIETNSDYVELIITASRYKETADELQYALRRVLDWAETVAGDIVEKDQSEDEVKSIEEAKQALFNYEEKVSNHE